MLYNLKHILNVSKHSFLSTNSVLIPCTYVVLSSLCLQEYIYLHTVGPKYHLLVFYSGLPQELLLSDLDSVISVQLPPSHFQGVTAVALHQLSGVDRLQAGSRGKSKRDLLIQRPH